MIHLRHVTFYCLFLLEILVMLTNSLVMGGTDEGTNLHLSFTFEKLIED